MILVLPIAGVAALYGLVRGGSLDALARTDFRYAWVLFAGLVLQATFDIWDPEWLPQSGDLAVLIASNALVAVFLVLNRRLPGMWLAAGGMLLNLVVISLNGAMPVSMEAAEIAGAGNPPADLGFKHEVLDSDTLLPWLGDVIPLPGFSALISVGDVVLVLAIGWLVYRRTVSEPEENDGSRSAEASG